MANFYNSMNINVLKYFYQVTPYVKWWSGNILACLIASLVRDIGEFFERLIECPHLST